MDKIWLANYSPEIPVTIDPDIYASLPEFLEDLCRIYAEKTAFINFGVTLSYHHLSLLSRDLAAYFQNELGLKPGDRLALMMPNILQYPVALYAALRAGLIIVNINPLYTAVELKRELQNSGAKTLIVLANFIQTVEIVYQELPQLTVIVTEIGDLFDKFKGFAFNFAVKYILWQAPVWFNKNFHDFQKILKKGHELAFKAPLIKSEDLAFLQYTGGTTGIPKAAMLTHRNLIANILQCRAWIKGKLELGQEVLLAALPLYHIFSLTVSCFTFLALGGTCVLVTNPRKISQLISCWQKTSPSCMIGLNTLFLHLLVKPEFSNLDFKDLKLTVAGGMATSDKVAHAWQKITNCVITEGYGLTEASPVVAINPLNRAEFNGSIGFPVPATEIKICDDGGRELPINEIGELWVRGPQVMSGYWQNPVETAIVLDDERWLHTGDLVKMDGRGFIYLIDRKKDLIIVSGFNVYPSEVERVIASHPQVADVVVVGEAVPETGEIIKAVIVKKESELTAEAIIQYCHQQLTPYKIPKKIEFRLSLPKSSLGKVLRREL